MTGDIDDGQALAGEEIHVSKTKLDRDAPFFFLLEPVGIYSGERFDEIGLP